MIPLERIRTSTFLDGEEIVTWLKETFGTATPIIGLLHLQELPGDPFFDSENSIQTVIESAHRDLEALQLGGVDGILMTNEFSLPYQKHVSPVTLASMGTVIGSLLAYMETPFGAEAIYDGDATIELCAATDAPFTRCMFTGAWAGNLGIFDRDVSQTLRLKSALRLDALKLFYFVTSEEEVYLNDRSTAEIAESMSERAAEIPAGSDGVMRLPYFAGERSPLNDPDARGVFIGLEVSHTREHLYRSAIEGICHSIAQITRHHARSC